MRARCAALVLALAAAGCTAGTEEPGAVGYVLLDQEARSSGQLAQDTWAGSPVLPVALDATEPVAFSSAAGRTVFDLRPGALAYVHGRGGSIEWLRVGSDVGGDKLRVYGTKEAAEQLARRVAGRVVEGADGRWTIEAPEIFERVSFLKVPDGIAEIVPDRNGAEPVVGARLGDAPGVEKLAVLGNALPQAEGEGARQAAVVGVYTLGNNALVLDAAGTFSLEDACSGEVIGSGGYRVDAERVMLEGDRDGLVLAWENGSLRHPDGQRYAPLIVQESPAKESGGEP